jgi:biopolymer transport protein ExbB
MWEIIQLGGPVMWPIILCSIMGAAIVLERLWTLQQKRVLPHELTEQVWRWVQNNQVTDKLIAALEQNSPLGRVLAVGLVNRHRTRDIMKERLEDAGRHVVHELERFLNTLGTIASISPLLGLLGTVTGIIRAFNAISLEGTGDPRVLSAGIGEALIATAAGLCVAIPSLFAYRILRGKVNRIVIQMEKEAMKLVDAMEDAGVRSMSSPITRATGTS